jgi:uncharacterized protein YbaA (DUF1428 family)
MANKSKKQSGIYVDGFVLLVPKKNIAAYKKMALAGGKVWKKYGALDYKECIGDDLTPDMPDMDGEKIMTFLELAKPKKGEMVLFSFITYKSRKHRDEVNAKVMKQMEKDYEKHKDMKMPFDIKRMAYGGFQTIVSL